MKKSIFFALIACLMATSCEKILGDIDFLKQDMAIQGTVSPTLGAPIAHGSISLNDLINMVQVTEAKIEVDENDYVTIVYDDTSSNTVNFESKRKHGRSFKGNRKSDGDSDTSTSRFNGSLPIDIFNNIDSSLNGANVSIGSLYVDLGTFLHANTQQDASTTLDLMDSFYVYAYLDSIYLTAIDKHGNTNTLFFDSVMIPADSLVLGHHFNLLKQADIKEFINMRPVEIEYGANINIVFTSEFWAKDSLDAADFVFDSIGINSIDILADIKANFPVATQIQGLTYNQNLTFAPSFDLKDLTIDSSEIVLTFNNGLPLELGITATLIDSTDYGGIDSLDLVTNATLRGAPVVLDGNNRYVSSGKNPSTIKIPVTKKIFDFLIRTNAIRLSAMLSTTSTGDATNPTVTVKSSDVLDVYVTAKLKPSYPLDIDVSGNSNDNNNEEGGEE